MHDKWNRSDSTRMYIYTQKDNEILPIDNNIYLVKTKKNLWWIDGKKNTLCNIVTAKGWWSEYYSQQLKKL